MKNESTLNMERTRLASAISHTAIGATIFPALLLCDLYVLCFERHRQLYKSKSFMASFLMNLCTCLLDALVAVTDIAEAFSISETACQNLWAATIVIFVFQKQTLYLFLYFRAMLVHRSLESNSKCLEHAGRHALFAASTVSVIFLPVLLTNFLGKISADGVCLVVILNALPINLALVIGDILISMLLITLFYVPIRAHLQKMKQMTSRSRALVDLQRSANRNLYLSVAAVVSTAVGLITFSVLQNLAQDAKDGSLDYYHNLSTLVESVELILTTFCVRRMSTAWIPKSIYVRLFKHHKVSTEPEAVTPKVTGAPADKSVASAAGAATPSSKEHAMVVPASPRIITGAPAQSRGV